MSRRDELLAAIEAGDHMAIRRREWGEVWSHLATSNAPRQGCTLSELVAYVKIAGNEPVEDVLEALEACAGEWRPVPGEVRAYLNRKRGGSARTDVGRSRDRAGEPDALAAVADAIRNGEAVCSCDRHRPTWRRDDRWVLRCIEPACGGLEPGQVHGAEDLGLIEAAA